MTPTAQAYSAKKINEVVVNRHKRAAATRLLKILAPDVREERTYTRVGDQPIADAIVAACEGPLGATEFAFLLAHTPFPSFSSLLRPKSGNFRRLAAVEKEFEEVEETYGANPKKWFRGLLFEVNAHLYLYTDQPLQEYEGLDFIRFSDGGRHRCVTSLEAFVEANKHYDL